MVLIWYKTFFFYTIFSIEKMWNVYMETGPSLEPGPQGSGIWKKKCQNPDCKIIRTKLKPAPKELQFFFLKSKPEPELLY
jgi:hypothetical protein